jgi:hypothetical protein
MSQIKFHAVVSGKPLEVVAGWDRPLAEFYLTLFHLDPQEEAETFWSTLDEPSEQDTRSTARLRAKLFDLGIQAPPGFWETVELRESNVIHFMVAGATA